MLIATCSNTSLATATIATFFDCIAIPMSYECPFGLTTLSPPPNHRIAPPCSYRAYVGIGERMESLVRGVAGVSGSLVSSFNNPHSRSDGVLFYLDQATSELLFRTRCIVTGPSPLLRGVLRERKWLFGVNAGMHTARYPSSRDTLTASWVAYRLRIVLQSSGDPP